MSHGGGGDDVIGIAFSIGAAVAIGGLWLAAVLSRNQSGPPTSYRSAQPPLAEHKTAPVEQLTSLNLAELKRLIEDTRSRRTQIEYEIRVVEKQRNWATFRRVVAMVPLLPLFAMLLLAPRFAKKLYIRMGKTIAELESHIETLNAKLKASVISLDFEVSAEVARAFNDLETAFEGVRSCKAKWDITTEWRADQFRWRTIASRSVERKPVDLVWGDGPYIESSRHALMFGNVTGTTIYIYPGFAMITGRGAEFALVELTDLTIQGRPTTFIEDGQPPADAEVIGQTWLKANKDGSRDRRFSYNRQIPILRYGEIHLKSANGVDELYLLSRAEPCMIFDGSFNLLKRTVQPPSGLKPILSIISSMNAARQPMPELPYNDGA